MDNKINDCYKELGLAIVYRAAQDYIYGCKHKRKYAREPEKYKAIKENFDSAVKFFKSGDFILYFELKDVDILQLLETKYGSFYS